MRRSSPATWTSCPCPPPTDGHACRLHSHARRVPALLERLAPRCSDDLAGVGSERSVHSVDQLLLAERLEHVRGSAGGERLLGESAIAGQRDDEGRPLAADEPRCVDAAQARQPEVQQDDVRPVLAGKLDGLDAVMRVGAHHEARILERESEAHERVVLRGGRSVQRRSPWRSLLRVDREHEKGGWSEASMPVIANGDDLQPPATTPAVGNPTSGPTRSGAGEGDSCSRRH